MYSERDTCPAKDWYDQLGGCKKCLDWCYEAKMLAPCETDYDADGDLDDLDNVLTTYEGESLPAYDLDEAKLPF